MLVGASPFNTNIGAMKNSGDSEKNMDKQSNIDESSRLNFDQFLAIPSNIAKKE
jgi:hypothetical protein